MKEIYLPGSFIKFCCLTVSFLAFAFWANATTYYSKATGNANQTATWGTNADGTGTAPGNFTTSGDIFILRSASTLSLNANWSVGAGVTLQIDGKLNVTGNNDDITISGAVIFTSTNTNQITLTGGGNGNDFTLTSGATLKTANSNGIRGSATSSLPLTASGAISLNTGANYEFNGATQSTAGLPSTVNDLTFSGSGTKTMPAGTQNVTGNFTVSSTAVVSAPAGSTVNFNGSALQTITGSTTFNNATINNAAGVLLGTSTNITVAQSLALATGFITTNANFVIIANGGTITRTNGFINGNLREWIPGTGTYNFYVANGTVLANNYRPVTINFTSLTTAGYLTISQLTGPHPQISTAGISPYINPYWTLTSSGVAGTYSATFTFLTTDASSAGIGSPATMVANQYVGSAWNTATAGTRTATTNQVTGLTTFGDFTFGLTTGVPAVTTQPSNGTICSTTLTTSFTAASTSKPTPTVKWQRSSDGGSSWTDITANLDVSVTYSGFTSNNLTLTGSPDLTGLNTYQYRPVYTNLNGSSTNAVAATLTVTTAPAATIAYTGSPYGKSDNNTYTATITGSGGGTFTASGGLNIISSSTGSIIPSANAAGNYTVTYTIPAGGGCPQFQTTAPVTITLAPTVDISYTANPFCKSVSTAQAGTFTNGQGTWTGGTFSYTVVSGGPTLSLNSNGDIIPSTSSAGVYNVIYTIPAASPYPSSTTSTTVTITDVPTITTFSYGGGGSFCSSDQTENLPTLNGTGNFTGGTFAKTSGSGTLILDASTGAITPFGSTAGTYNITYTSLAVGGCSSITAVTTINITNVSTATLTYTQPSFCKAFNSAVPTVIGLSGGTFSADPGLTIDATTGVIDPSTSTLGSYVVTYTVTTGPCGQVQLTTNVDIEETPTANINYSAASFCQAGGNQTVNLTGTGNFSGGTFTASPSGLSINGSNGSFNPTPSSPNNYTVTYTTPGCPVTATADVEITAAPNATISYSPNAFCTSDGSLRTITLIGDSSGAFTAPGGLSINTNTGSVTPSTSTPGSYTVTYTIMAQGTCAQVVKTTNVVINQQPAISAHPSTTIQEVCKNGTLTALSVTATGTALTYQWYSNTTASNSGGTIIPGALSSTYTPPTTVAGTFYYYAIVDGACSSPVTSDVSGAVIIDAPPAITIQPSNGSQNACQGTGTFAPITVTATGTNLTYQWFSNTTASNSGGTNLGTANGAQTNSYTPQTSAAGTLYYYVVISGTCTPSVTSSVSGAIITNSSPLISVHPSTAAQNICLNGTSTALSVTASGIGITYQWYSNTTNSNSGGTLISGATASTYTPLTTAAGTLYYYVVVSGTCSPSVTSNVSGAITVYSNSVGGSFSPSLVAVCTGASPSFTLSGFTGSVTGWQQSTNAGANWTNISSTANPYTAASITQTTLYRATVKNGVCAVDTSSIVQVVIDAPFTPTVTATTSPVCIGGSIALGASGYTSSGQVITGGDFSSSNPPGWNGSSAANNSGNNNADWGIANNSSVFNGQTYNSSDFKYMVATGRTASAGFTTNLTTPTFSLIGLSSAYLALRQAYNLAAGAMAQIQISTNGGTTYTDLQTNVGSGSAPGVIYGPTNGLHPTEYINLSAYLGLSNLKIRFFYTGSTGSNWAIDNVFITNVNNGTNPTGTNVYNNVSYTWTAVAPAPIGALSPTNSQNVTFNSSTSGSGSFTYNVTTTTSAAGCTGAAAGTITVIVNDTTIAGNVTPKNAYACSAPGTATLTLTGNTGSITRWESSTDNGATWGNTGISTSPYSPSVAAVTTLYRALVQSGVCPAKYSDTAKVGLHNYWTGATSTDWQTANNWSDGLLPSTACPTVTIPTGAPRMPTLSSGTSTILNLNIQSSASAIVTGTGLLTIGGNITVTSPGTFNVTNGSLEFNGTSPQSIAGSLFVGNNIKNLRVSNTSGSGLSLAAGVPFNVLGALDFGKDNSTLTTNNILILRSTDSSTARVADITNNGAFANNKFDGKVTVERFFPPDRSWRLLTSPLSKPGNIYSSWQNNRIPAVTAPGKGMYVTGPTPNPATNGLDSSTQNNYSMYSWDVAAQKFVGVDNTRTTQLSDSAASATNKGFFTFVRGDRTPSNTFLPNTNKTTLSSTGFLQTGTQTFNVSPLKIDTFSLVGNPYASPVDMAKITRNNVANRFIVWDPKLSEVGAYVTMEEVSPGVYQPTPSSLGGQDNYIQSSQAFFVQTVADGPASVVFNESSKADSTRLGMFRPVSPAERKSLSVYLYKFRPNKTAYLADGTYVQFDNAFAAGIDVEDATKFTNINETFGIMRNSRFLAVERRPEIAETDTLFFRLTKTSRRKYQFAIAPQNLAQENLTAFIEDKFLQTKTPLNLESQTDVDFEVNADAASAAADRFKIVFRPSAIYTDMDAKVVNGDIAVNWSVSSEFNIQHYEVERSVDGDNFTKVNEQPAAKNDFTNAVYNSLDASPAIGYYYYRIKSISNNGVIGYSNTVKVKINKSTPAMYVLPNPVTNNIIQVQMNSLPAGVYDARLLTSTGQLVFADIISHAPGTATETLLPRKKLTAGIYQLKITAPDKKVTVIKVAVE